MNNKGSITDILIAMVMLTIAAIVILFVLYIWSQISSNAIFTSSTAKPIVTSVSTSFSFLADGLVLMFFMSCFAAILLAYFVPTHPVFLIVAIALLIPLILVADVFANVWQQIISTSFLTVVGNTYFAYVTLLFKFLPFISLTIAGILLIMMYSKPSASPFT
jgi:hypothetical protein